MFSYWYLISIALRFVVPAAVAIGAFFLMRYWSGRIMACGACRAPVGDLATLRCSNCNGDLREVGVVRRGAALCWATAIVIAFWMFLWPIVAGLTMVRVMNAVPQIGTHMPQTTLGRPTSSGYADAIIDANVHLRSGWFGRPGEVIRREWTATFCDDGGKTVARVTVDAKESTVVFERGGQSTRVDAPLTAEGFDEWLRQAFPNVRDPYWLREEAEEIMVLAEEWMAIEWSAAAARRRYHDARARTLAQFESATFGRGSSFRMRSGGGGMLLFEPVVPRQLFYYGYFLFSLIPAIIILLVGRRLLRRQAAVTGHEAKRGGAEERA